MKLETIILGAGESGVGAALLAQWLGERVFVSDAGKPNDCFTNELFEAGIEYEVEGHDKERLLNAGIIIKSPGIPDSVALIQDLKAKGIEVISEIEYAYRVKPDNSQIVALTGSNGKTTTTMLTNHLLVSGQHQLRMGGNIGTSFARLVLEDLQTPSDRELLYVLELSSFQLDGITSFRPNVAAVLNITADHLDRYDYDIANYANSKMRIGQSQIAEDKCFVYQNSSVVAAAIATAELRSEVIDITDEQIGEEGKLYCGYDTFSLMTTALKGKHNALNALFAISIAQEFGLSKSLIQTGLDTFQTVAHRMENVASINNVLYINDSKATNVDATYYALDAMTTSTIWIAGGTDKGNDYEDILALAKDKVKALVCLGVDNSKLIAAFESVIPTIIETQSMVSALEQANKLAKAGDTVLLSPACASFDLFKNYIDRGDQFRTGVRAMLSNDETATSVVQNNKPS